MDDPFFVSGFERLGDLARDPKCLGDRQMVRPSSSRSANVVSLHQFEHERTRRLPSLVRMSSRP